MQTGRMAKRYPKLISGLEKKNKIFTHKKKVSQKEDKNLNDVI